MEMVYRIRENLFFREKKEKYIFLCHFHNKKPRNKENI